MVHCRICWEVGWIVPLVQACGAHKSTWQMVAASSEDNLDDGCFSSILKISFSMIGGAESSRLGKSVILKLRLRSRSEFVIKVLWVLRVPKVRKIPKVSETSSNLDSIDVARFARKRIYSSSSSSSSLNSKSKSKSKCSWGLQFLGHFEPWIFPFFNFQDFFGLEMMNFQFCEFCDFFNFSAFGDAPGWIFSFSNLQDFSITSTSLRWTLFIFLSRSSRFVSASDSDLQFFFLQCLFMKDSLPNAEQRMEIVKVTLYNVYKVLTWNTGQTRPFRHEWLNTVSHFEIFKILPRFRIEASLKYIFVFWLSFSRLT